ncbi:hypothetical protein CC86DRAFT_369868 [Ophiobolus disseminans]|uniref:Uncharacterized protein n=1 Tax=Ophiobolus disseminans TaxID=1469910 RepID=A0A6A7A017_9PLEO|nr:hypothetical protein CC86DRAFT_369868 [Ophiobolus disseminans]
MDNWRDPWAEHAEHAKSPAKAEVTSPLPPTFAPAPTLLGGFLDDAGWGNDDDSFGDWSAAPATAEDATPTKTSMTEVYAPPTFEHTSDDIPWGRTEEEDSYAVHGEGDWAAVESDAPKDGERVASESSDTSTTIQADEVADDSPTDAPIHAQPDDDCSTRASTSPSDTSHNDAPAESPRTSYEEERGAVKVTEILGEGHDTVVESEAKVSDPIYPESANSQDGNEGVLQDTSRAETSEHDGESTDRTFDRSSDTSGPSLAAAGDALEPASSIKGLISPSTDTFVIDSDLLYKLFSPPEETKNLEEAPDDPIYSTSARKAWYRLTRKQTMREYNNGNHDDNYVRVTWANSNVRSEVNKVIGRWAREDRISGTGPGARASFYWDTPAPDPEVTSMHTRQQSSQPVSNANAPSRESIPPLSTDAPATFNWSSPLAPVDPWHQIGPGLRSTSSPIVPLQQEQRQEIRVTSLDVASHKPDPASGMQTLATDDETPSVTTLISPLPVNTITSSSDPRAGLDAFDITSPFTSELGIAPVDDEDEWGEMVSTPTVVTHTPTATSSQPDLGNVPVSIPNTPPQPTKDTAFQDQSPDTMHAAPIVRLRSTISPTSALFKANSFIPLGAEQGPIGPGLLKSAKRVASVTATKADEKPPSTTELRPPPIARPVEISRTATGDVFSAWQTSAPEVVVEKSQADEPVRSLVSPTVREPARPSTPPQHVIAPAQETVDSWANADFSFFESSAPAAPVTPPKQNPTDPLSVFESPPRSTSSASSAKTFTRSPPRKITPPPVQPLTGATSSALRRKNEEDQIIHGILGGLPDLSYMLRRA